MKTGNNSLKCHTETYNEVLRSLYILENSVFSIHLNLNDIT